MTTKNGRALGLCIALLLSTGAPLWASDPVGIYAIVERVVLEPNDDAPERIQIWGAFALTDGKSDDGYLAPQRGYLYYRLQPGKETISRREWADLRAVAGTGEGIGFGQRYQPRATVHAANTTPSTPDAYPIGVGVVRMGSKHNQPRIIVQLREVLTAPR